MAYLNHNLPPFSAYIRNEYLFDHEKGHGEFTFADVHTVNSLERRALLFECLLPNGVNWTRRPIHAFCWKKDAPKHPLNIHQYWDCFVWMMVTFLLILITGLFGMMMLSWKKD